MFNTYKTVAGILALFTTVVAWNNTRITNGVVKHEELTKVLAAERVATQVYVRSVVDSSQAAERKQLEAIGKWFIDEHMAPLTSMHKELIQQSADNTKLLREVVRSQNTSAHKTRLLSMMDRDSILRDNDRLRRELQTQQQINQIRSVYPPHR